MNDLRYKLFLALSASVYALLRVGYDALLWMWEKPCVSTSNHAELDHAARSTSGASETARAVHTIVEFSFRLFLFQTHDDWGAMRRHSLITERCR